MFFLTDNYWKWFIPPPLRQILAAPLYTEQVYNYRNLSREAERNIMQGCLKVRLLLIKLSHEFYDFMYDFLSFWLYDFYQTYDFTNLINFLILINNYY